MKPRPADWLVVPIMALLGILGLVLFHNITTSGTGAEIVPGTVSQAGDGMVDVEIVWSFPSTPDQVETATVRVPEEDVADGLVVVWRDEEGFTVVDPGSALSTGDFILVGLLGALLGAVMVMTVRGFGYVRGTGDVGSTPDLAVAEDRGFYWRT
jgi:hypothetical protein